jgi:GH15 family glucan-1,4-alpha-glucosidase
MNDSDASAASSDRYPPIGDYAFIGDCHSGALVSRRGSIDWCCMPRVDSASLFGRLLDWDRAGYCLVAPVDADAETSRSYLNDTMVVETVFRTSTGQARLLDCFTTHPGGAAAPDRQLLRVIEGTSGRIDLRVEVAARFDFGATKPWVRLHRPRLWSAMGGDDAITVSAGLDLQLVDRHDLQGDVSVAAGERVRLALTYYRPEQLDPEPPAEADDAELDRRLDATVDWWRSWVADASETGQHAAGARRSALVLKALSNAPTGAISAAPTTSLPEEVGGSRNWDYRYSWIRDSQFTLRSLTELGFDREADGFRRFIERTAAGSPTDLQVMYGLGGQRRLTETTLPLQGYRSSTPVRIGNAASGQLQLDVYGEMLELAWRWHQRGRSPDDDYWRFLRGIVDLAAERWPEPDQGLWEIRGEPRHFVHSKVMCWVALERGIDLAADCLRQAPSRRWRTARNEIRESIEANGVDRDRDCYVQAYGAVDMDASLLLLPSVDYVAYDHPRMLATADAITEDLDQSGLLRRYRSHDGLSEDEGIFVACTFWLAECLAHQGRLVQAQTVFERAMGTANDLGLFSEEYDPENQLALGNFPQGLSHLSHIAAVVALDRSRSRLHL